MIIKVRNVKLFNDSVALRKQGKSYLAINKELGISKSTLSTWFSGVKWSDDIKCELAKKNRDDSYLWGALMGRIRSSKKQQRLLDYQKEARLEYEQLVKDPLFITGLSLYWGEGEKVQKGRVSIINSDVSMIKVVSAFFRKTLEIPDSKLRAALFLYSDHDPVKLLDFWSNQINIPKQQFIKTQILPSRSKLTKRRATYGMCSIYFCNTQIGAKIQEWIKIHAQYYAGVVQW